MTMHILGVQVRTACLPEGSLDGMGASSCGAGIAVAVVADVKDACTLSPRSISLTATSSLVLLFFMSLHTPKAPLPTSRTCVRAQHLQVQNRARAYASSDTPGGRIAGMKSRVRFLQISVLSFEARLPSAEANRLS